MPLVPAQGSLPSDRLAALNQRHDRPGLLQLAFHLAVLVTGGLLWARALGQGPLAASHLPAPLGLLGLLLLGHGLDFAFCAIHEAGHRTAFASRALNDGVAWWAYLLELTAISWWMGKVRGHLTGLRGDFKQHPYIQADAVPAL